MNDRCGCGAPSQPPWRTTLPVVGCMALFSSGSGFLQGVLHGGTLRWHLSRQGRSPGLSPPALERGRLLHVQHPLTGQPTPSLAAQSTVESSHVAAPTDKRELVGHESFKRKNPHSDRFQIKKFHHIEFYCGDATNVARRFMWGLGMAMVAKTDQSTGNTNHASYVLQSNDLRFVFTAPYSLANVSPDLPSPMPGFNATHAQEFFLKHGLAAKAICIEVGDAAEAYRQCVANGGKGVVEPTQMGDATGRVVVAEVVGYGDVVLRFLSHGGADGSGVLPYTGPFLPGFEAVSTGGGGPPLNFGLQRVDHAVGNVWDLMAKVRELSEMTGMHEFAEFVADDVGTGDSGLNSVVLASNNEMVILPLNEPTYGTRRKSQIQTYLEQNEGPGLQHLALKTNDIFSTLRQMRERSYTGGFAFMEPPPKEYYRQLPDRIPELTPQQLSLIEELGLLADKDDQGILLQIFTLPVGDRPTLFLEVIQRIGCMEEGADGSQVQRGGCGGFGKGNFAALFKSIEDYEKTLKTGQD